jgi:hypothetical protein
MFQDVKFGFRSLRATPGFTAVALVILTLGIGATTAIYSVVDAIALRGLPFQRADRLMIVDETNPSGKGLTGGYVAAPNFYDWRAQQTSFEDLAAFQGLNLTTFTNGEPESLRTLMISASLMPLLRVTPQIGQLFGSDREVAGRTDNAGLQNLLQRHKGRFRASQLPPRFSTSAACPHTAVQKLVGGAGLLPCFSATAGPWQVALYRRRGTACA